jgi:multidrug transporter EmrE-like cation transporter
MSYLYILSTIVLTVYGQLILKWRISHYGQMPDPILKKIVFLLWLIVDPYIFSGLIAAFLASLCWMGALTEMDLNHAYPFMGLTFVLVLFLSSFLFHESITLLKILGVLFIIAGIAVGSQG